MALYFGFVPSSKLISMLNEVDLILASENSKPYYIQRNLIAQQVAQELIERMLLDLIEIIPNSQRRDTMAKIALKVESSTNSLLSLLLAEDSDVEVLPTIDFLFNETLFNDNEGNRRIGFKLNDSDAQAIQAGFDTVQLNEANQRSFQIAIETMSKNVLTHFMTDFAKSLPLGVIKRNSVIVAKSGITKLVAIAINRLLPKLDSAGYNRFANFYRQFIVEIPD